MNTEARLQELADHRELTDLVSRLYSVLDEERFGDLAGIYTADAVLVFPSATMEGLEAIERVARRRADAYESMQHLTTDVLIELEGDRAVLRTNHVAFHVHRDTAAGERFDAGVVHRFDAVRTPAGWRLSRADGRVVWTSGRSPAA